MNMFVLDMQLNSYKLAVYNSTKRDDSAMSISYAIMAGLENSPKTGYELTKGFQGSIGFFWNATHQQIYRELEKIHNLGWTTVHIEPQAGKPDRKIYSLTEIGRDELRRWIESPTDEGASRDPLLVKLFVGHIADTQKLIADLEHKQQAHEKQLKQYRDLESQHFSQKKLPPNMRFQLYTLRYGIRFEEGWLSWCKDVLHDLRKK